MKSVAHSLFRGLFFSFKMIALTIVLFIAVQNAVSAQTLPSGRTVIFDSYQDFSDSLNSMAGHANADTINAFWNRLKAAHQIPFAAGDSVAFLYKGNPISVEWNGDFNGWGDDGAYAGQKLAGTNIFIYETAFPDSARLDYKVVLSGSAWILDPSNPWTQYGGFGPNSELRMPNYQPEILKKRGEGVPAGVLSANIKITSPALGYDINYRVYLPAGYDEASQVPAIYALDGHEYLDSNLGSFRIVMDNLVFQDRMPPAVVVFIDPRNPSNGDNRRADEYTLNPKFAEFVAEELVPEIDAKYKTRSASEARLIMGLSYGGLSTTDIAFRHSDVFGVAGPMSPSYWYNSQELIGKFSASETLPIRFIMTTGTINDTQDSARPMRDVMMQKGYDLTYKEVAEAHSWGNWSALIDNIVEGAFGDESLWVSSEKMFVPPAESNIKLSVWPNPAQDSLTLSFSSVHNHSGNLFLFDVSGKKMALIKNVQINIGLNRLSYDLSGINLPAGTYFVRLDTPAGPYTQSFVKIE